jgi:hypothetical protein
VTSAVLLVACADPPPGDAGADDVEAGGTHSTAPGDTDTGGPPPAAVGSADCADAPVEVAARAGDVRKVCLYADGATCTIHADDPTATSCAVHVSLLNFEWNLGPPQERRLLEFYGWTAVSWDRGSLVPGQGIESAALVLTELELGTPIHVTARHDDSGATYDITFSFETSALAVASVVR